MNARRLGPLGRPAVRGFSALRLPIEIASRSLSSGRAERGRVGSQ